jgi:anthraniloyl-CoA monooxygenase
MKLYDAFTFDFRKTEHGWFQACIYKFDDEDLDLHRRDHREKPGSRHGLDKLEPAVDRLLRGSCSPTVLDGARLMTNARHLRGSAAWLKFNRLICEQVEFNGNSHVVLMGDAAHTAHFAIGSGTKLAIDDAIG